MNSGSMSAEGVVLKQNKVKKFVFKNPLEEKSQLSDSSSSWDYDAKPSWEGYTQLSK